MRSCIPENLKLLLDKKTAVEIYGDLIPRRSTSLLDKKAAVERYEAVAWSSNG
jgi:hypothetical protein